MVIARENNLEPFANIPEAPRRYWTMFESGVKLTPPTSHTFTMNESVKPPASEMRVSDLIEQPA